MRVAITGATGVIGSAIVKRLSCTHEVVAVPRSELPGICDALVCAHGSLMNCIDVNLNHTLECAYAAIRHTAKHIVLLGGAGVGGDGISKLPKYAASKGGLVAWAESMSKLAPHLSINVVAPGPVKSPMCADGGSPEPAAEMVARLLELEAGSFSGNLVSALHDAELMMHMPGIYKLRRVAA